MAATMIRHYGGGAIDAHDVEERVMRVLNSFSKIDQSKVSPLVLLFFTFIFPLKSFFSVVAALQGLPLH